MTLSKKSIVFIVLAGIAILYGATAYWAGIKAEKALEEQYRTLTLQGIFTPLSRTYQRGWFGATEIIEFRINKDIADRYQHFLPEHLKGLLGQTIRVTQHIQHGPILYAKPFDIRLGNALVTSQFTISASTRDALVPFFGDREPITITNHIHFNGNGVAEIILLPFDYREVLSGIKIQWKGFDLRLSYNRHFTEYEYNASIPGLVLHIPALSDITLENVHYLSHKQKDAKGHLRHTSQLSVAQLSTAWFGQAIDDIDIKKEAGWLNHARQLARFINPIGNMSLTDVHVTNLHYRLTTKEANQLISARGILGFDGLKFANKYYGRMVLDVIARRLHAPTLNALWNQLKTVKHQGTADKDMRQGYLAVIKKQGIPLLWHQPELLLQKFELKTPEGTAKVSGYIKLSDLNQKTPDQKTVLFEDFDAQLLIDLPHDLLEDLLIAQTHHLFNNHSNDKKALSAVEMQDLAKSLVNLQLQILNAQGYIENDGKQLKTRLTLKEGKLTLNGKRILLPWESASR